MSKVSVLVGLQWGDEGKGKVVDLLSPQYNVVARYQGGANAGHTIVFNDKKYVLHLIPAGIFSENIICVIGNGVVLDFVALLEEMSLIKSEGISFEGRLFISRNLHIIMPYHKIIDAINESGNNKIGTTKKGIGPAYYDKYARRGIKLQDFETPHSLKEKIETNLKYFKILFKDSEEIINMNPENVFNEVMDYYLKIEDYICDCDILLNDAIDEGKSILLEGAQGALLDVDFGTYPYITSSHPTSGGASIGTGIPPTKINSVIGIFKAYTTRVGEGPFVTELFDDNGKEMAKIGNEFGATTGRQRRCGWLDLVALKYSCRINGVTHLVITKSDVLDNFDEIKACVSYESDGKQLNGFITNCEVLKNIKPIYKTFKGWKSNLSEAKSAEELPKEYKNYIKFIEEYVGCSVKLISTGPSREQVIEVD